ncbi:hypothetical protein DFH07DRAFT_1005273 [Mycena maculata]|uniref:DUF6534 domain-containing protein n=1 Tax=Mycena maculata TaxID=230809 RepID=A0AAD7HLS5_9AGAR|nr:hypothetical protein DFH07DRAFT_1005273 [Mycena maculata]
MHNIAAEYFLGPWALVLNWSSKESSLLKQFVKYFGTYRDDPLALKIFVGILAVGTYVKSIEAFTIIWFQLVINFGDLVAANNLRYTAWFESITPVTAAIIVLYVQSYFCLRFLRMSKKWYLAAPLSIMFIGGFVAIALACHYNFIDDGISFSWYRASVIIGLIADILLTSGTTYFLIRSRQNVLPQSVGMLNALIRLTFQTAAPATVCSLINFVLSYTFPAVIPGARPTSSIATNIIFPKLYAVSMMWTLNARQDIRMAFDPSHVAETGTSASGLNFRTGRTLIGDAEGETKRGTTLEKPSQGQPRSSAYDDNSATEPFGEGDGEAATSVRSEVSTLDEVLFAPPCPRSKAWASSTQFEAVM